MSLRIRTSTHQELIIAEIWDLFERRHLFRARNPERKLDDGYHLAEMQAVLGNPPLEFLAQSERSLQFWDKNGLCGIFLPESFTRRDYSLRT
jgi:hypothetical protein